VSIGRRSGLEKRVDSPAVAYDEHDRDRGKDGGHDGLPVNSVEEKEGEHDGHDGGDGEGISSAVLRGDGPDEEADEGSDKSTDDADDLRRSEDVSGEEARRGAPELTKPNVVSPTYCVEVMAAMMMTQSPRSR